jgi:hypothetical protein
MEFGQRLCSQVLREVHHRHIVFSIPKILRRYFLYDRDLLSDLSRCAWESLKLFLQEAVPERNPIPGAVIAIQAILKHPGLWLVKSRPTPKAHAPPAGYIREPLKADYSLSMKTLTLRNTG